MASPKPRVVDNLTQVPKPTRKVWPDRAISTFEVNEISKRNSIKSPLLRLPAELRNQIYEYVLGGEIYKISSSCVDNRRYAAGNVSRLHFVCRQIYNETSTLPFSLNTFSVANPFNLSDFARSLSSSQRNAIKTIRFELMGSIRASYTLWKARYNGSIWATMLKGLQTVLIQRNCRARYIIAGQQEEEMRGLKRVITSWRADITVRESGYYCYRIKDGQQCGPLSECRMLSLANGG